MKISQLAKKVKPLVLGCLIQQAIAAMIDTDTDFLPVIDNEAKYCGIVTLPRLLAAERNCASEFLTEACLARVPAYNLDSNFADVPVTVDQFVVIDAENKVVGVVTPAQLLKCVLDYFFEWERTKTGKRNFDEALPFTATYNLIKELINNQEAIFESSYDGIFITDGDGVVLRLNEAYERITGISASQVIGKSMAKLVEEGIYDQSVTLFVLEQRKRMTINQIVKPTNTHILVTGNPIFDEHGRISLVVTNVRDVTELTNLQKTLSKTKAETLKYQTELSHLRSLQIKSGDIIFRSKAMESVLEMAAKVANVNSTVLITGESGTGKELVAKFIHREGKGADKPFIQINCGAIPESLLESELFGYERGAFTGARKDGKPGLFELANNGTLFLDEIGELPLSLQVKLLRAIQEKTATRVGAVSSYHVDVRIIAATHRDLAQMVKEGTFREDLYYRLMVVPIKIPPLRERREDIPLLVMHFMKKFNKEFGFNKRMSPQVIDKLVEYSWPGNVRELENVIERMVVTSSENELTPLSLPISVMQNKMLPKVGTKLKSAVAYTEKVLLSEAFRKYGTWQKAAEALGIDRTTAYRKALKYGLIKE